MKQRNFLITALSISVLFFSCSKDDDSLGKSDNAVVIRAAGTTPTTGSTPIDYTMRVTIQNSAFTPSDVTVMVSGSILWVNSDNVVHTVTADDGSFDSGDLQPGTSFGFTFNTVGPYPYRCKYHGEMTGVVKCVTK